MTKVNATQELQARIMELKVRGEEEAIALKSELSMIVENIHPIQILTAGIKEVIKSPDVQREILSLSTGFSAGHMARQLVIGKSENKLQQFMGNVVGLIVSKNITLNSDKIQSTFASLLKSLIGKRESNEEGKDLHDEGPLRE